MLNKIILMGRLGRDPDLKYTQSGTKVASFSLAVDRDFKDKASGERATDWVDVVAWTSTAEFAAKYFHKGQQAVVEGRLQVRAILEGRKAVTRRVVMPKHLRVLDSHYYIAGACLPGIVCGDSSDAGHPAEGRNSKQLSQQKIKGKAWHCHAYSHRKKGLLYGT